MIIVVSGLPRSGTSMMMRMLHLSGIAITSDRARPADGSNPNGYFETTSANQLAAGNTAWLSEVDGAAVKVVSHHLRHLPANYEYRVILMRRDLSEVIESQEKMRALEDTSQNHFIAKDLYRLYQTHSRQIRHWLRFQNNMTFLEVEYASLLTDTLAATNRISGFIGQKLSPQAVESVDLNLYRSKGRPSADAVP